MGHGMADAARMAQAARYEVDLSADVDDVRRRGFKCREARRTVVAARPPFPVSHHFQSTDHTCGPAALRMVFDSLWGVELLEDELAEWLETDQDIGTRQRAIEHLVGRFGLTARSFHTATTVDDLRELLKRGHVIMVLYHLEEENTDHYAVVKGITKHYVVLNDPWLGPDVPMAIHEFEGLWHTRDEVPGRKDRWALAVRDKTVDQIVPKDKAADPQEAAPAA